MKGRKKGTKNSTQMTSQKGIIAIFTDTDNPEYKGVFMNKKHAADYIGAQIKATSTKFLASSIQKYLAYKLHTLHGFIPIIMDLQSNPLDGIDENLIMKAKGEAVIRRQRAILSRMTVAQSSKLSESQIERISKILNEK